MLATIGWDDNQQSSGMKATAGIRDTKHDFPTMGNDGKRMID